MASQTNVGPLIVLGREQLESVRKWIEIEIRQCNEELKLVLSQSEPELQRLTRIAASKRVLRYYRARLIKAERFLSKQNGVVGSAGSGS